MCIQGPGSYTIMVWYGSCLNNWSLLYDPRNRVFFIQY